jgi:HPt (histidine-containing phosphotransfer) domain-containing protein
MQAQLNALLERHCKTIKASVTTLGLQLAAIAEGSPAEPLAAIEEAEALAHQLKGSTGTAGFHDICRAATALDDHLKTMCAGDAGSVAAGIGEARRLFEGLDQAAQAATPGASSLYGMV